MTFCFSSDRIDSIESSNNGVCSAITDIIGMSDRIVSSDSSGCSDFTECSDYSHISDSCETSDISDRYVSSERGDNYVSSERSDSCYNKLVSFLGLSDWKTKLRQTRRSRTGSFTNNVVIKPLK